jgi:hypothetical protein
VLGGLYQAGAVDQNDGIVFANGLNWPNLGVPDTNMAPAGGDLYAVSLDGRTMLWDFHTPAPNGSGVAMANGVVYFQSLDGNLYALNANAPDADHALLASFATGGNYSGPAVADGHIFLGTGAVIPMFPYTQYHNSITALGLPSGRSAAVPMSPSVLGAAGTPSTGQVNQATSVTTQAAPPVGDGTPPAKVPPDQSALFSALASMLGDERGHHSGADVAAVDAVNDLLAGQFGLTV